MEAKSIFAYYVPGEERRGEERKISPPVFGLETYLPTHHHRCWCEQIILKVVEILSRNSGPADTELYTLKGPVW